jgi:hypothetical protein
MAGGRKYGWRRNASGIGCIENSDISTVFITRFAVEHQGSVPALEAQGNYRSARGAYQATTP